VPVAAVAARPDAHAIAARMLDDLGVAAVHVVGGSGVDVRELARQGVVVDRPAEA
jgi:hypothetical protein